MMASIVLLTHVFDVMQCVNDKGHCNIFLTHIFKNGATALVPVRLVYTIYRFSFAIYLAASMTSHANAYMFTFTIFKYIIQVQFGNSICRSRAHEALVI